MRYATWIEPDEDGNTIERTMSEEEIVATMKKVAEKLGKPYLSDEEAFWDFVVVSWADVHED